MAQGLLGRKVGMTSVYIEGQQVPVTVIEAGPCPVVQVKTREGKDGYDALQLGFLPKPERNVNRPSKGHFDRAGINPTRVLREFRDMTGFEEGKEVSIGDVLHEGDMVNVRGTSKGRGFAGVMKRWNFHGHKASHGTHESKRGPGSIGQASYPARVIKGMKMAGHHGSATITVKGLEVIEIIAEKNLVLIMGAVPGARNSILEIRKVD